MGRQTLWEYIKRFSKKRNELPNITNADVINAFTYGMMCEALDYALRHNAPQTTWELLDVTTKYATGEEAVHTNFSSKCKAAAYLSGGDCGEDSAAAHHRRDKRARNKKHHGEEMVAMAKCATHPHPHGKGPCPEHFEKALEVPCPFHGG
jgi:hypothetical protein